MFRVGRGDERFSRGGITHLVEHLALFGIGEAAYEFNGFVDDTDTVFFAEGTADEVAGYLNHVAAALGALPLDRLEVEKRILRTEAAGQAPGPAARLLAHRVGLTGYGAAAYEELGLRSLTPAEVAARAGGGAAASPRGRRGNGRVRGRHGAPARAPGGGGLRGRRAPPVPPDAA